MVAAQQRNESTVSKEDLIQLSSKRKLMASAMGEARGEYGKACKALEEKGFNGKVFNAIVGLTKGKNAAGIGAVLRCFDEYVNLMGLRDQTDIEDYLAKMPDTRTDLEKQMDGDLAGKANPPGNVHEFPARSRKGKGKRGQDGTDAVINPPASPADDEAAAAAKEANLARFKASLAEADTPERVNKGLEKFQADHPELTEEALELAGDRLSELAPV